MSVKAGRFAFGDFVRAITEELVRRHPHVFGNTSDLSLEALCEPWQRDSGTAPGPAPRLKSRFGDHQRKDRDDARKRGPAQDEPDAEQPVVARRQWLIPASPVRFAIHMKKAMPVPVPNRMQAPITWVSLRIT
jgi:hypothetical protein